MLFRMSIFKLNCRTTRFYCSINASPSVNKAPKKSLREQWKERLKVLVSDYKDVLVDCGKYSVQHPFKSGFWLALLAGVMTLRELNPDEKSYRTTVIEKANEMIFVGKPIRNPAAEEYLRTIETYYNRDQIFRLNFGIFSVIFNNFKSNQCNSFKDNCSYVQPSYVEFLRQHIIDVGFLNTWWLFKRQMIDFDVNPNEWKDSNTE